MLGYILFFVLIAWCLTVKRQERALILAFVIITLFSALRYGIGYDFYSYLVSCMPYSYIGERFEYIPRQIVILSQATTPYLFFVLTSFFISAFYYLGIRKGGRDYRFEMLWYLGFPFLFFNQLGVIRQGMATSVIFFAITMWRTNSRNWKLFLIEFLLIVVAILCHQSAYVAFFILIPWEKISKAHLWVMFIGSFFIGSVAPIIGDVVTMGFLDEEASESALRYLNKDAHGEGKMIKWLIYFVGVMALYFYDRLAKLDKKNKYYIGVLIMGVSLFALFSYNSSISKRLCMFYFTASIFIVPELAKQIRMSKNVYVSLCALLFVLQIYISSSNTRPQDEPGCSVSYPYRTWVERILK